MDKQIPIFVYGTLKRGYPLNGHMTNIGATFCSRAKILDKSYVMRNLGSYPALQSVAEGSGHTIKGELWLTDVEGIQHLDKVESCPNLYQRRTVTVWDGEHSIDAVVYYIPGEGNYDWLNRCSVIESGLWEEQQAEYDCSDYEITEEEEVSTDFEVEQGIYIINDWGEHYGPFDSITEACQELKAIVRQMGVATNTLTVGFRMTRTNLTADELADIDNMTFPPENV